MVMDHQNIMLWLVFVKSRLLVNNNYISIIYDVTVTKKISFVNLYREYNSLLLYLPFQ
jgi:hypothetical protein